jgi:hypothetical protein
VHVSLEVSPSLLYSRDGVDASARIQSTSACLFHSDKPSKSGLDRKTCQEVSSSF